MMGANPDGDEKRERAGEAETGESPGVEGLCGRSAVFCLIEAEKDEESTGDGADDCSDDVGRREADEQAEEQTDTCSGKELKHHAPPQDRHFSALLVGQ